MLSLPSSAVFLAEYFIANLDQEIPFQQLPLFQDLVFQPSEEKSTRSNDQIKTRQLQDYLHGLKIFAMHHTCLLFNPTIRPTV